MKITMDGADFNRIMRVCSPALDRKGTRRALEFIEIRCMDGLGTATGCDGITLAHCQFTYEGDDGTFLLPRHRNVANGAEITIVAKGDKISVSDGDETITRDFHGTLEHANWKNVVSGIEKEAQRATITMSASRLRRLLAAFDSDDDAVTFEIRGDIDGVFMRAHQTFALLLPMRTDGQRNLARFVKPGEEGAQ